MSLLKRRWRIGHQLDRFNSFLMSSRLRSGCRMMCPAGCLPSASCAALPCSCLPLSHPLCLSVSPFVPSLVSRLFPLFACPSCLASRRLVPSGMSVSSHPLVLPALVSPLAPPCLPSPFLVSPGGAFLVSLSFRHASRLSSLRTCLPSCVPLALGKRLRMSSPRSCVSLLPCRPFLVSLSRPAVRVGERGDVGR